VLGRGESLPDLASNKQAAQVIKSNLARMEDESRRKRWDSYVFNDQNTNVYVSSNAGNLVLSGTPSYYTFWYAGPDKQHLRIEPNSTLNTWLDSQNPQLRSINPAVWDNAVTTSRYAAFFRYVKLRNPEGWRAFVRQISTVVPPPDIQTPDIIIDPRLKEMADWDAAFSESKNKPAKKHP
jgi:hypothetical protein